MNEAKRQKLVYTFAGVIVAITLYVQFGIQGKPKNLEPVSPAAAVTIEQSQGVASIEAGTLIKQPTFVVHATPIELKDGWGNDPFAPENSRGVFRKSSQQPTTASNDQTDIWRLGGIIYLPSKPVAYVNDQPVHVGQLINGATVTDITRNTVILHIRGERKTLTLGKG